MRMSSAKPPRVRADLKRTPEGTPESARMMVVLVSTSDAGLEIFPTHRLFRGHDDALTGTGEAASPAEAVSSLAGLPYDAPIIQLPVETSFLGKLIGAAGAVEILDDGVRGIPKRRGDCRRHGAAQDLPGELILSLAHPFHLTLLLEQTTSEKALVCLRVARYLCPIFSSGVMRVPLGSTRTGRGGGGPVVSCTSKNVDMSLRMEPFSIPPSFRVSQSAASKPSCAAF